MADAEDGESRPVVTGITGLDRGEFSEAFQVFSNGSDELSAANLTPFLRSLGIRRGTAPEEAIVERVKKEFHGSIREEDLRQIVVKQMPILDDEEQEWPSDTDVLEAFRVFDSESVGFIKVTLLKRFLQQAELGAEDADLERLIRDNCQIDGDDLINYQEFVSNIMSKQS